MLLLGHMGITAFLLTLVFLPAIFAVIGVLLPDVIDKGLFLLGITPCGRFFAHSIFFAPIIGLVTFAVTRRKDIAIAIALGSFMHLIEDLGHFLPWFYPFVDYPFAELCKGFRVGFNWFSYLTEAIGAGLFILTFGYRSKVLVLREKLWKYLRKSTKVL